MSNSEETLRLALQASGDPWVEVHPYGEFHGLMVQKVNNNTIRFYELDGVEQGYILHSNREREDVGLLYLKNHHARYTNTDFPYGDTVLFRSNDVDRKYTLCTERGYCKVESIHHGDTVQFFQFATRMDVHGDW